MEALTLKEITKRNLLYANTLTGRHQVFAFAIPDQTDAILSFNDTLEHYVPSIGIQLKIADEPIEFWLDSFPLLERFHERFKDLTWETIPAELKPIVLESISQPLLASLQTVFQKTFFIESLLTAPSETLPKYFFSIDAHQQSAETYQGHIGCSEPFFIDYILPKLSLEAICTPNDIDIPFPFSIEIGKTSLETKEFTQLAEQDIILIDNDDLVAQNQVLLRSKTGISYQAKLENHHLTILGTMSQNTDNATEDEKLDPIFEEDDDEEHSLEGSAKLDDDDEKEETKDNNSAAKTKETAAPPSKSEAKKTLSLENLPIALRFEVGRQIIPLKELQTLKEGFVFETQHTIEKPVDILANGKKIAIGELVKINEHLGIRILSLSR